MIFDNAEKKEEEKNEGMEVLEAVAQLVLLFGTLAVAEAAHQVQEKGSSACEAVKNGVQQGLETLKNCAESGYEAVMQGLDYINPFTLNNTIDGSGQKIDPETVPTGPLARSGKAMV